MRLGVWDFRLDGNGADRNPTPLKQEYRDKTPLVIERDRCQWPDLIIFMTLIIIESKGF
jgi:hypothetical protein